MTNENKKHCSAGEIAYEAYRNQTGGKSLVTARPIPEWSGLSEPIKTAWEAAAKAVLESDIVPPRIPDGK